MKTQATTAHDKENEKLPLAPSNARCRVNEYDGDAVRRCFGPTAVVDWAHCFGRVWPNLMWLGTFTAGQNPECTHNVYRWLPSRREYYRDQGTIQDELHPIAGYKWDGKCATCGHDYFECRGNCTCLSCNAQRQSEIKKGLWFREDPIGEKPPRFRIQFPEGKEREMEAQTKPKHKILVSQHFVPETRDDFSYRVDRTQNCLCHAIGTYLTKEEVQAAIDNGHDVTIKFADD